MSGPEALLLCSVVLLGQVSDSLKPDNCEVLPVELPNYLLNKVYHQPQRKSVT